MASSPLDRLPPQHTEMVARRTLEPKLSPSVLEAVISHYHTTMDSIVPNSTMPNNLLVTFSL